MMSVAAPPVVQAQTRFAAFAHGITFGDDRPSASDQSLEEIRSEKGSRWEKSGTPENWKNTGVISDYTLLRYFDRDLYGGGRDKTLDASRDEMMERFVQQMKDKTDGVSNPQWVLIGHSQGGIVVRLLHKYIRNNHPDVNVKGVLAAGSPLQGARAARMAFHTNKSSYYDVAPELIDFVRDVLRAPIADTFEDTILSIGYQPYGGSSWVELGSNFFDYYGYIADGISSVIANTKIDGRVDAISYDKRGAPAFGPDGYLIDKINSGPQPDRYRSLIGAERYPIPARVGSGAVTGSPLGLSWLPPTLLGSGALASSLELKSLGFLLVGTGSASPQEVAPGDEPTTVRFYQNVINLYNFLEQFYDSEQGPPFYSECWDGDGYNPCAREDRWNNGHDALKSFPDTYSEIIDSYKLAQRTGRKRICGPGADPRYRESQRFSPPTAEKHINNIRQRLPRDCFWKEYTYYVTVPDESDGIVTVQAGTWSENSSPNDREHNFLFGNDGGSQDKTGFNHAELVYDERRFSSYADPASYTVSFTAGQDNPPMQNAKDWARQTFLKRGN